MTNIEFFKAVANNEITTDVIAKAEELIAKDELTKAKRAEKVSKKAQENQPLVEKIVNDIIGTDTMTASDVAGVLEISTQKASALLKAGVAQGLLVQGETKVAKKGMVKTYSRT